MSHEQVPTVVIIRLKTGKSTIPGCVHGIGCMVYGVGWSPKVVIIRPETGKTTIPGVGC